MKEMFNFCPIHGYDVELEQRQQTLEQFAQEVGVNGVELLAYGTTAATDASKYKASTIGVHLRYWTFWVDFWRNNQPKVAVQFPQTSDIVTYYGADNTADWLKVIRKNIISGLSYQPQYVVWHVSEASNIEAFTLKFGHSDLEVIDATIEVVNEVLEALPKNILLLFENLWWPGLRLDQPRLVERLLSGIKRDKVGLMLDTGHLANTNSALVTERDLVEYEKSIVRNLGSLKQYIRGMHLNSSLSGAYLNTFPRSLPEKMTLGNIYENIVNIDRHQPFTDSSIRELVNLVEPDYLVHELYYDNFADLKGKLRQQRKALFD